MKVGIVCYPTVGGSGVVATELGHALAKKGHDIHFITYELPFKLRLNEEHTHFHEVDIYQYDLFRYPDYALTLAVKIAEVAKSESLDILHVHYAIPHATSAFLAKQLLGEKAPKIVTTLHGTDITLVGRDPAYFEVVKFSIEQSDAVTAVSHGLKKETQDYFQIDCPIDVIYNFFHPSSKPFPFGREEFVSSDEKLIMHASNFRGVKRVPDVITIFYEIQKTIPSKLLLVGSGAGIEDIKNLVHSLNLNDKVIFQGKTKEIDPYLACSDLFLLPSSHESFGLVALEALSYGVPVIASNVSGLPEVIDHGKIGFLAPVGDTSAMAKYAKTLLSDPKAYKEMSSAAKKAAVNRFSTEKVVSQYLDLYNRLNTKN